jgi:hypothetical protein
MTDFAPVPMVPMKDEALVPMMDEAAAAPLTAGALEDPVNIQHL